jgi:hypothetical protein
LRGEKQQRQGRSRPSLVLTLYREWRKHQEGLQGQSGTLRVLVGLGIPAGIALVVCALVEGGTVLAFGLLTATAAFAAGAFLGFLFGIPRSVAAQQADASTAASSPHFAPNTNLEQISDWLTKILVGVGLVQVHQVGAAVSDLADGIAPGLGQHGNAVATTLMISFSITGFVSAYLFTRLRLQSAFELAAAIKQAVKERADTETAAIALVQKQLSPGGDDRPSLEEMTQALKAATPGIRAQAYFLAREQRRENWRGEQASEDPAVVALAVPVFKSLIACDPEEHFYRLRGQLGYALKDQDQPDFAGAKMALEEAIQLRPEHDRTHRYEFNLAYCEIALDRQGYGKGQPSSAALVSTVCVNLAVAAQSEAGRDAIRAKKAGRGPNIVRQWLKLNRGDPQVEAIRKAVKS